MIFPILYKTWKTGQIAYWECKVEGDTYYTRAGVFKNRDKHIWKPHKRDNYGTYTPDHGSYRTPEEIALEHAQSDWNIKLRNDAMTIDINDLIDESKKKYKKPLCCVLATRYKKLKIRHDKYLSCIEAEKKPTARMYTFPDREFYVEYKMDGERGTVCNLDGVITINSRGRSEIPHCDSIKSIFSKIYSIWSKKYPFMNEWQFDGEIILPGETRNRMRSTISTIKEKHIDNDKIVIYLFDLITEYNVPYSERRRLLNIIMGKVSSKYVQLMPTIGMTKLNDDTKINEYLGYALSMGVEGIILRDPDMLYPLGGDRIDGLIKHKPRNDCEMRIISCYEGTDYHQGLIMFKCQDLNDGMIQQDITPSWTREERILAFQMYIEDPSIFIGKYLTIVYTSKNEFGKLIEANGSCIRDPKDISTPLKEKRY